jgi:predicted membrane protein
MVLIGIGVRMMTRTGRHRGTLYVGARAAADQRSGTSGLGEPISPSGDTLDTGAAVAILGGVHRVSAAVAFEGTEVTALMGGVKLDLRRAILSPGREAVVDLVVVMGGCELIVPPQWIVSAPVVALMGGIDDKRVVPIPNVVQDATTSSASPPRLVIRGFIMIGGVTLRS